MEIDQTLLNWHLRKTGEQIESWHKPKFSVDKNGISILRWRCHICGEMMVEDSLNDCAASEATRRVKEHGRNHLLNVGLLALI